MATNGRRRNGQFEKGYIPWWIERGLPHPMKNPAVSKKVSEARKGRIPWNTGKPWSEDVKKRISEGRMGKGMGKRPKQSERLQGEANPAKRSNVRRKISEALRGKPKSIESTMKRRKRVILICHVCGREYEVRKHREESSKYCSMKCRGKALAQQVENNFRIKVKQIRNTFLALQVKPTEPEKKLIRILKTHSLPFRYVGDGSLLIHGLNPDFVGCNGKKQVIEVFGRRFHDPYCEYSVGKILSHRTFKGRKAVLGKYGWDCLIFWDDELDNETEVVRRVSEFITQ